MHNFSKDNFTVKPQNDGAFICQNSWGENFGDDGIFYISYERYKNRAAEYSVFGSREYR